LTKVQLHDMYTVCMHCPSHGKIGCHAVLTLLQTQL